MTPSKSLLAATGTLLRAAVDIADGSYDLAERRRALISLLGEATDSDNGHWIWTRTRPGIDEVFPIASIRWGYTDGQYAALQNFLANPRQQAFLHPKLAEHIERSDRHDGFYIVTMRSGAPEVYAEQDHWLYREMLEIGVGEWMQAGCYQMGDVLTVLNLGRRPGKPPFSEADCQLLDVAFSNIPWLWPSPDERVPQSDIESLTPRQRAVASLLLDGLSRKQIASRLGIGEETVNHHTKCVFRHFGVQSATELAALFLRGQ